ncbi:MAG: T9SS type A sorting domain-containing protein [Flavobacteriales bacterium]|nr:T9SS type A sorting domain-containing protein [Flavobacteriales bacterium]
MNKLLFVLINLLVITTQAQKSSVAAGGNAAGTSGTASYSIGQISYKSPAGTIVSDGVQQPYEIQVLGTSDYPNIALVMVVYPNPTSNLLTLKIPQENLSDLSYQVYDINGKIVYGLQKITNLETTFSMENNPKGVYFLNVISNDGTIKSFKILKK